MNTLNTFLRRCSARLIAAALLAAPLTLPLEARAAIVGRSPGLAYDSTLNVTWATDARLFDTLAAGMGGNLALAQAIHRTHSRVVNQPNQYSPPLLVQGLPGVHPSYDLISSEQLLDGTVVPFPDFALTPPRRGRVEFNWFAAQAFVSYLNDINYQNHDDWRLPRMLDGACVVSMNTLASSCAGGPWNEVQSLYVSLGQEFESGLTLSHPSGRNESYRLFSGQVGIGDYWLLDEVERVRSAGFLPNGEFAGIEIDYGNFASALRALQSGDTDGDSQAVDKRFTYAGILILRDGDTAPVTDAIGGNPVPLPAPLGLLASAVLILLTTGARRARRGNNQSRRRDC